MSDFVILPFIYFRGMFLLSHPVFGPEIYSKKLNYEQNVGINARCFTCKNCRTKNVDFGV